MAPSSSWIHMIYFWLVTWVKIRLATYFVQGYISLQPGYGSALIQLQDIINHVSFLKNIMLLMLGWRGCCLGMPRSDYASGGIYLYNVHYITYVQNNNHLWRKSGHARIIICHLHHHYQVRGAHVFWEKFLYRLSHDAAEGGAVRHTHNQLEAAVHNKRSTEAIELIPEACV